ncbi:MAG: DUF885 domain-containing protein [Sphingobacteriales bacterium]|nr:MAG: DUF885 domain-containing protein [Sphingobacteriales bacterium]
MRKNAFIKLGFGFAIAAASVLQSCEQIKTTDKTTDNQQTTDSSDTKQVNVFFDQVFDKMLSRTPMYAAYLGEKTHYDEWNNISDEFAKENIEIIKSDLETLQKTFDIKKLDYQGQLSYKLFVEDAKKEIEAFPWRFHNYPINPQEGLHTEVPTFLMNVHKIDSLPDAKAYISRLQKVDPLFDQLIENLKVREQKGIILPKFAYPKMIDACRNIISGAPFDKSKEMNPLMADFSVKTDNLKSVSQVTKDSLRTEAGKALLTSVKPAYEKLIIYLTELEKKSTTTVGAWSWPDGNTYYSMAVRHSTTTQMSPEEVYNLGLKEVARIHNEIRGIMKKTNFKSDDIKAFFRFMTSDKQFYYPNTDAGKKAYLKQNTDYIETMKGSLDKLFLTKPKANIEVRAVEKFREQSAGTAFYEQPSPDGTRPGIFYANLYDMTQVPIYQIEALAYHEGIPGHHMQISIAQELTGVPKFRKYGDHTAYVEGWGLYSELIPKEIGGFYTDVYQDFGRLSMELMRSARLVVDPGIHYKKWTREQAIQYFMDNTAEPPGECVNAIERYIVWPGQATAYKVGMNKILELRTKAQNELGEKFDLREFHDVVLLYGSLTLDLLEENVNHWIEVKKSGKSM